MRCLLVIFALLGVCAAAYNRGQFNGRYYDHCGNDGFYFKNAGYFVVCSNGNAYEFPCPVGTRNSEYGHYSVGTQYNYRDFCDVNLNSHRRYGYGHKQTQSYDDHDSYGHDNYGSDYSHDSSYGNSHDNSHGSGRDKNYGVSRGRSYDNVYGQSYDSHHGNSYGKSYDNGQKISYGYRRPKKAYKAKKATNYAAY